MQLTQRSEQLCLTAKVAAQRCVRHVKCRVLSAIGGRQIQGRCDSCIQTRKNAWQRHGTVEHCGHACSEEELTLARFRKGRGCSRCNGVGFSGRRGAYEMLEITEKLTDALQRDDARLIDEIGRAQVGQRTLAHGAVTVALDGRTTVAEAMTIAE